MILVLYNDVESEKTSLVWNGNTMKMSFTQPPCARQLGCFSSQDTLRMAPVGVVGVLGWFSPEVGIISLIAFLVLSVTLVALCARCNR